MTKMSYKQYLYEEINKKTNISSKKYLRNKIMTASLNFLFNPFPKLILNVQCSGLHNITISASEAHVINKY